MRLRPRKAPVLLCSLAPTDDGFPVSPSLPQPPSSPPDGSMCSCSAAGCLCALVNRSVDRYRRPRDRHLPHPITASIFLPHTSVPTCTLCPALFGLLSHWLICVQSPVQELIPLGILPLPKVTFTLILSLFKKYLIVILCHTSFWHLHQQPLPPPTPPMLSVTQQRDPRECCLDRNTEIDSWIVSHTYPVQCFGSCSSSCWFRC